MSIENLAKEISHLAKTMRSKGRKIYRYGYKVHVLRRKIKKIQEKIVSKGKKGKKTQRYEKRLIETHEKSKKIMEKLVSNMSKYADAMHLAHKRLQLLKEELGKK